MYNTDDIINMIPRTEDDRFSGIILQGRPGIGKTHFAQSLVPDGVLVRVPMATRTFEDFGSYPFPVRDEVEVSKLDREGHPVLDKDNNIVKEMKNIVHVEQALSEVSIEPLLRENIGNDYGILLLDDVTLGDPRLQSSILEIVQFGVIAGRQLGRNVFVILTGNTTEDGAYAVEWSKALLGRCMLIGLEPNFDIWTGYPDNQDVDAVVVAFLKDHAQFFAPNVDDEKTTDANGKTPAPRDWTRLGKALTQIGGYKNFKGNFIFDSVTAYAGSMVGSKAGTAFAQYAQNFGVYPTGAEVFDSAKAWSQVPSQKQDLLSGAMAVVFALRNHAIGLLQDNLDDQDKCYEIIKTMLDRTRLIATQNREIVAYMTKHFLNWATANKAKRTKVMLATCDVLTSDEYQKDTDFKNFLDALYKAKNKR
jgi:hypothetical protein